MSPMQVLPLAPDRADWSFAPKTELGADGACDLIFRTGGESPALPPELAAAVPLLLHEFDRQPRLAETLAQFGRDAGEHELAASPKAVLARIVPRVVTYRFIDRLKQHEFVFDGHRPSSVHVLARVFGAGFRFRLEDLAHFATHGELLLRVLHTVGLKRSVDPEAILYCPAVDSPYPFKFAIVHRSERGNRDAYVDLLKQLLRNTESDEAFRARNFAELARGFQKFGPAAATPRFQEVELQIWRLLTYLAARLRVKAGRLTDSTDPRELVGFLGELRHVHRAVEDLVHLPGRLAARFRTRFDLEFSAVAEEALPELQAIAARIDCDLEDRDKSIDAVAALVSEFRGLGSCSPLEALELFDRGVKHAYGDVEVPEIEVGWARVYTDTIYTGAQRFDTRRFGDGDEAAGEQLSEEDFDLGMDIDFGFGGGGATPSELAVEEWQDEGEASASSVEVDDWLDEGEADAGSASGVEVADWLDEDEADAGADEGAADISDVEAWLDQEDGMDAWDLGEVDLDSEWGI